MELCKHLAKTLSTTLEVDIDVTFC